MRFILFGDCPHPSWPVAELEENAYRCDHWCLTDHARYDRDVYPDFQVPALPGNTL